MRYLLYFILVVVASAAAAFAIIGIPGHLSRKPPLEVFPDMDRRPSSVRKSLLTFLRTALAHNCHPPEPWCAARRLRRRTVRFYAWQNVPFNTGRITGTTNFCGDQSNDRGRRLAPARPPAI